MLDTKTPTAQPKRPNRRLWLLPAIGLGFAFLVAGIGIVWWLSGDAPDAVNLDETAAVIAQEDGSEVAGDQTPVADGIEGSWNIDTSVGTFSLDETTTSTFVGFRVDEVLNSIGSTTAVGRTPEVSGSITIDGTSLTEVDIEADLTGLVSDSDMRDNRVQDALGTDANPTATFTLESPIELGEGAATGEVISVTTTGHLTINGVTNHVDVLIEAQLIDNQILVTGTTEVVFSDFGVAVPDSPSVLAVEDFGTVEVQLWLTR